MGKTKTRSDKPDNVTTSDVTQTSFKIHFTQRASTTFTIRINDKDGNGNWKEKYKGVCADGDTLMSLKSGTDYLIQLWALEYLNPNKTDSESVTLNVRTHDPPTRPWPPRNLRSSDETKDSAIFRFDDPEPGHTPPDRYWVKVNGGVLTMVSSGQRLLSLNPRHHRNTIELYAENAQGKSDVATTDIYTKADPPSAPSNIKVNTSDGTVNFTGSADGGGDNNITYYYSYIDPLDKSRIQTGSISSGGKISFSPGLTYSLGIHANNSGGDSAISLSDVFTMDLVPPDSPNVDNVTTTDTTASFIISGPTNKGGALTVTYYVIQSDEDISPNSKKVYVTSTPLFINLNANTNYTYRVFAWNNAGYSRNPGKVVKFTTKYGPPGPPTNVNVGRGTSRITFDAPTNTGGCDASLLTYSFSIDAGVTKKSLKSGDTFPDILISGNSITYTVYVYSKNPDSGTVASLPKTLMLNIIPPSMPKNMNIGRGDGNLTLERPDDDGGDSNISIYYHKSLVEKKEQMNGSWDSTGNKWSGEVRFTRDELLNVYVYAKNSAGYSDYNYKVIKMTVQPPSSPRNLNINPNTGFLTFDPPEDNGGNSEMNYYYTSTYTIFDTPIDSGGGFIDYREYQPLTVYLYANNSIYYKDTETSAGGSGTTATGNFSMKMGTTAPSEPQNIDISYNDDNTYHMSFGAPRNTGGVNNITYYYNTTKNVNLSNKTAKNASSKVIVSGNSITNTEGNEFESNTTYKVFVYATNRNGTSSAAVSSFLTPPKNADELFSSYYKNVFLEYKGGISSLSNADTSTDCIALYSNVSDNLNRLKYNYALLNKYIIDNSVSSNTLYHFQDGDDVSGDILVSTILSDVSGKIMSLSEKITGLVKNDTSKCGYSQLSEDQQSSIYLAQRNKVGPLNYNIVENQGITKWDSAEAIEDNYLSTAYLLMPSNMNKQIYIDDYVGLSGEVTKVENNVEFSKLSITTENFAVRETFINPFYSEITPAASVTETTINLKDYTIKSDALRIYNKYLSDISDISNQLLDDSSPDSNSSSRLTKAQEYLVKFTSYVIDISNVITSASNQLTDAATEYQNYTTYKTGYVFYSPNEEAAKANKVSAKADYLEVYKYYCAIFKNIEYSTESLMITLLEKLLNTSTTKMDTYHADIIKLDADNKKLDVNVNDFILTIENQVTTLEDKMASASTEIININRIHEFYTKTLQPVLNAFNNLTLTPPSIFILSQEKLPDIPSTTIYSIPKPVGIVYSNSTNDNSDPPLLIPETTNFDERVSLYYKKIDSDKTIEIAKYQIMVEVEINFFEQNVNDITIISPNDALQKILDNIDLLSESLDRKHLTIDHLSSTIYGGFDFETNEYDHGIVNDSHELTVKYLEKLKDLADAIYTQNNNLQNNESKVDKVTPLQEKYYKNQTIQSGLMYSNVFFVIYILLFAIICYILYAQPDGSLYTKIFSILFLLSYPFWIYPSEYFIYQFVIAIVSRISNSARSFFVLLTRMNGTY
jgi:hypothetical protein